MRDHHLLVFRSFFSSLYELELGLGLFDVGHDERTRGAEMSFRSGGRKRQKWVRFKLTVLQEEQSVAEVWLDYPDPPHTLATWEAFEKAMLDKSASETLDFCRYGNGSIMGPPRSSTTTPKISSPSEWKNRVRVRVV